MSTVPLMLLCHYFNNFFPLVPDSGFCFFVIPRMVLKTILNKSHYYTSLLVDINPLIHTLCMESYHLGIDLIEVISCSQISFVYVTSCSQISFVYKNFMRNCQTLFRTQDIQSLWYLPDTSIQPVKEKEWAVSAGHHDPV